MKFKNFFHNILTGFVSLFPIIIIILFMFLVDEVCSFDKDAVTQEEEDLRNMLIFMVSFSFSAGYAIGWILVAAKSSIKDSLGRKELDSVDGRVEYRTLNGKLVWTEKLNASHSYGMDLAETASEEGYGCFIILLGTITLGFGPLWLYITIDSPSWSGILLGSLTGLFGFLAAILFLKNVEKSYPIIPISYVLSFLSFIVALVIVGIGITLMITQSPPLTWMKYVNHSCIFLLLFLIFASAITTRD